jgi:hypothetical protein
MYVFKNTDLMTIYDAITGAGGSTALLQTIIDRLTSTSLSTSVADSLQEEIGGIDYTILQTQVYGGKTAAEWLQYIQLDTQNISLHTSQIRTPQIISTSTSGTISVQIHSLSVYNSGAAVGTFTANGTTINVPAGVTIYFHITQRGQLF